jgi:hypothetical protein
MTGEAGTTQCKPNDGEKTNKKKKKKKKTNK